MHETVQNCKEKRTMSSEEKAQLEKSYREENGTAELEFSVGGEKLTIYAPKEEFEGFKRNVHNLIRAFISFILSTGIELHKDKTSDGLNMLLSEFEQFKNTVEVKGILSRSEFEQFKKAIRDLM